MANIKFHGHEHLLALIDINMCSQRTKWECNACGWEIEDDLILRCVECKYNSHISCLAVSPPETTMYKHHQHSLTLRPDHKTLVRDQNASYYCDACNKKRILNHPFYSCTECDYNTHVHCVVTEYGLNGRGILRHFSHKHVLTCSEKIDGDCFACKKPFQGSGYSCHHCRFYLDKSCAEQPQKIKNPFRKHPLILSGPHSGVGVECSACYRNGIGFMYTCVTCVDKDHATFFLDLDYASLQPTLESELVHEHIVTGCVFCAANSCGT